MALTQVTKSGITADAIDATKIADNAVDSEHIAADSIDAEHYAAGSVDATALGADAVTAAKIGDDIIDSEHYADGSIDNAHIADDAIDSEHYADGSIDNAHIADDAIDSEHYAAGSIDTAHIAADQITAALIADDVVNSEHIAAGAVDLEHMSSESVDEDNLYISNSGSNGEFLSKQSGNNGGLTWAAAGGNLKTVTAVTTDGGSFSESAGYNKTSGSGFTLTTGANTNRIAIHLCFFAMAYDSNGAGPYSHASLYFHDSMTANEAPSGAAILLEMDYFGAYSWTGSTARHDEYFNNSLHAIATVSPSTEIFVQLCVRRGQYSDYVNVQEPRGMIMEYSQ